MAKIIEARVWQKVDTEANWLANPLPLGPGEQAFVSDKHNFKLNDTNSFKMFSELEYFYKGDVIGNVTLSDDLSLKSDGVYYAQTSGTYGGVVVKEGYYTLLRKKDGVWSLESEVKMPMQDLTPLEGKIKDNNDEIKNIIDETMVVDANYINYELFESGYVNLSGNYSTTNNWIKIPFKPVPNELKGKIVTLKGLKVTSSSALKLCIKDLGGNIILSVAGNSNTKDSFTIPNNSDTWAFTIANETNIGLTPLDNAYVNTAMLYLGVEDKNFIKYKEPNLLLNSDKIYNADEIVFKNDIEVGNQGAVPSYKIKEFEDRVLDLTIESPNLIDYKNVFESGNWNALGQESVSNNWLRTKRISFNQDIISKITDINYNNDLTLVVSGYKKLSDNAVRYVLFDENNAVIRITTQINSSDKGGYFTISIPSNARKISFNIANETNIGLTPLDNAYVNTFQMEIGVLPTSFSKYKELFINSDKIYNSSSIEFNTNEVVVIKKSNTNVDLLYHCGGDSDIWFKLTFYRQVNATKFVDTWRLNEGWKVKRTGDFSYVNIKQVILSGVYENAIYVSDYGYTDALGSSHGCELLSDFSLFLDGKPLNLESITNGVKGYNFQATQRSNFKKPNGIDNVGYSMKIWEISNSQINIKNKIKWIESLNISQNSYLSMLSVIRKSSEGNQITHSAVSDEDLTIYNVSESGFTTPIFSNGNDNNRNSIIIWGDDFKAEVLVNKRIAKLANGETLNNLANAGMYVQNSDLYNKIYGRFGSINVVNGDFFDVETTYKIKF